jgi:hypothetical protein
MMKRFWLLLALSAFTCAALACAEDPPPPIEEEPQVPRPQPALAADPEPTPTEVPIPEDFAAEAERDISTSDLRAQLDALEQEITMDK